MLHSQSTKNIFQIDNQRSPTSFQPGNARYTQSSSEMKRTQMITQYLKNPYNLQKEQLQTFSLIAMPNLAQQQVKTQPKRIKFTSTPKSRHLESLFQIKQNMHNSNFHYLLKTNEDFRKTKIQWQNSLENCLQSQHLDFQYPAQRKPYKLKMIHREWQPKRDLALSHIQNSHVDPSWRIQKNEINPSHQKPVQSIPYNTSPKVQITNEELMKISRIQTSNQGKRF